MGLTEDCEKFFGSTDLLKIFELERDADDKKIKKAYYKLSLKFHPDKCAVSERDENTKKFQCLGKIHKILSDKSKRDLYLETGEIDDELDNFNENSDWVQYWRNLYPKVTVKMLDDFKAKYQKSEEERKDVLDAYKKFKGKMDKIMDEIPCSEVEADESRFIKIIKEAIKTKEVKSYKAFTHESKASKQARKENAAQEAEEAEEYGKELGLGSNSSENDLAALILKRRNEKNNDFLAGLEAKYAKPAKKAKKSKKL